MFLSEAPNSVSNSVGMHHLASLLSKRSQSVYLGSLFSIFTQHFQTPKSSFQVMANGTVQRLSKTVLTSFQIALKGTILVSLFSNFRSISKLLDRRFKYCQNAPVSVLALHLLSAVPISKTSFQIALDGTVQPT